MTGIRAFGLAAGLGAIQVALAEAIGVTNFAGGFCCGGERDILTTYTLIAWFGGVAACVGPLLAVSRGRGMRRVDRALAALAGGAGALVGLPVVAFVAGRTPHGGDGGVGSSMMMGAFSSGVLLGLAVATAILTTPAHDTVVPAALIATTAVMWLVDVALTFHANPLRLSPGGIGLGRVGVHLGLLPYLLATLLWGLIGGTIVVRMRGRSWRRVETWLVGLAAAVLLALVVRLTIYLSNQAAPPLARPGDLAPRLLSSGLLYAAIGAGVVLGLGERTAGSLWSALAAVGGFVLVAGATWLTSAFGPDLSGDAAMVADMYDIAFGVVAALGLGALVGWVRTTEPVSALPI